MVPPRLPPGTPPGGSRAAGTSSQAGPTARARAARPVAPPPPTAHPARGTRGAPPLSVDVAVVGGGILGLAVARALLAHPGRPTVALVEAEATTAGGGGKTAAAPPPLPYGGRATGAGQGYLWLAHRDPASPLWAAAAASKALWAEWADGGGEGEASAWAPVEHRTTGSLLLAPSAGGEEACAARAARLAAAGVPARALSAAELAVCEPALARFPPGGGALLTPGDAQMNGRGGAAALLAACRRVGEGGRWVELTGAPVAAFDGCGEGGAVSLTLADGTGVRASRGIVVAAGAWSGGLVAAALARSDPAAAATWAGALAPRRGHLLVLPPPPAMPGLRHGMMEAGYTRHYSGGGGGGEGDGVDLPGLDPAAAAAWGVVFTAATAGDGPGAALLIGSSREDSDAFTGSTPCPAAVRAMLGRAAAFLPGLRAAEGWMEAAARAAADPEALRVGLRPAMLGRGGPGGAPPPPPAVGKVASGLFVAAGHEGSGLTLAPASGRLVAGLVLDGAAGEEDAGWAGAVDPGKVVERHAGSLESTV